MKIKNIVILGGGTAGFGTAAMLSEVAKDNKIDLNITVVHNEDIGIIGVGESTIFGINQYLRALKLKDGDWMRECNATHKTSIRFQDFYKKDRYFHYPFGGIHLEEKLANRWNFLHKNYPDIFTPEVASIYFQPISALNEFSKISTEDGYLDNHGAYHFDSHLFGKFLRRYSEERGVKVINDNYIDCTYDKKGNVESIVCDNDRYSADLFIDCSGFKSLLMEAIGGEYLSFDKTLLNNKVIRTRLPYTNKEEQLKTYTNCTALKNGWVWEIPTWDTLSVGYVHTNKFATPEEIESEFFKHIGKEVETDIIHFKTGRYKDGWIKNVVSVGLSYGFVEPLESNGIASIINNIFKLVEQLFVRELNVTSISRDCYNMGVGCDLDDYKGFVESHYTLSLRDDSEYWEYINDDIDWYNRDPRFGQGRFWYETYLYNIVKERDYDTSVSQEGKVFVNSGFNFHAYPLEDPLMTSETEASEFIKKLKYLMDLIKKEPSHHQYLLETIYTK